MTAPVIGAIVDFSPGINVMVNPLTLDDPFLGQLGVGALALSSANYVDISSLIKEAHIRRGRSRVVSKFEAGTATLDIHDQYRDWETDRKSTRLNSSH